jgi:hypothetical protein
MGRTKPPFFNDLNRTTEDWSRTDLWCATGSTLPVYDRFLICWVSFSVRKKSEELAFFIPLTLSLSQPGEGLWSVGSGLRVQLPLHVFDNLFDQSSILRQLFLRLSLETEHKNWLCV